MVSRYKRAVWRMRFAFRQVFSIQLLFGSVLVVGGISLLMLLLYGSSEPELDMTVIDVSEKKQRQLVAEWKAQQEDSKRRDREWERDAMDQGREAMEREQEWEAMKREREREAMQPIIAEDGEDSLEQDGEQYINLRRGGIQKTTTGRLGEILIGHRRTAKNKHFRPRRANNTALGIRQQQMVRLLNRAADDGDRHRSTTVDSVQVDMHDARPHIAGDFDCVPLAMSPGPTVCLYPDAEDEFISRTIRSSGLWEPRILNDTFKKILSDDPDLGVIDIGANIGVYSLVSAAMGHDVVAVEPFEGHLRRFHKAINLGKFEDRIVIVRDAISDRRGMVSLITPKDNQGAVRVKDACKLNASHCIRTVYMDDLTDVATHHIRSRRAVIKIDIEGHERFAFRRCDRLFDIIYVPYIIMEWHILRSFFVTDVYESADRTLVIELINQLLGRGYEAFSARTLQPLKTKVWYGWPSDVLWKHDLADVVR